MVYADLLHTRKGADSIASVAARLGVTYQTLNARVSHRVPINREAWLAVICLPQDDKFQFQFPATAVEKIRCPQCDSLRYGVVGSDSFQ